MEEKSPLQIRYQQDAAREHSMTQQRITFLEKQNEALLKALTKKAASDSSALLETIVEQQRQILKLSQQIGALQQSVRLQERRTATLWKEVRDGRQV